MRGARRGPFHDLPPEVAILASVSFTVALGFGVVAPAIPAFARQFGVDVTAASSVISVFALMRVVGALPAGRLVDRFGEPAVLAAVVLRRAPNQRSAAGGRPGVRSLVTLRRAVRSSTYRAAASANMADGFAALGMRGALVPLFVRTSCTGQRSGLGSGSSCSPR